MKKSAFTVARICHVRGESIKRWQEKEEIKGYYVSRGGHWRILPKDLGIFLRSNSIPFPDPEEIGIDVKALY